MNHQPSHRRLLTPDDKLFFLHIPKTGGTTFRFALESFYQPDEIFPAYWWQDLVNLPPEAILKARLIRGHFGWCLHQFMPFIPRRITVLRDPIERTLSHYEHYMRDNTICIYEDVKAMSLAEFVHNPKTRAILLNHQVYALGADVDMRTIIGEAHPHVDMRKFYYRVYEAQSQVPGKAALEVAKERLHEIDAVGITERFEQSLQLINDTFGLPLVREFQTLNTSPSKFDRAKIPQDALNEIVEITRLDRELYNYAVELFEQRYRQMMFDLYSAARASGRRPDLRLESNLLGTIRMLSLART